MSTVNGQDRKGKLNIEITSKQIINLLQEEGDRGASRKENYPQRFRTAAIKEVSLAFKEVSLAFSNQAVTKFGSGGNESTTAAKPSQ
jgi:hypothetical protein